MNRVTVHGELMGPPPFVNGGGMWRVVPGAPRDNGANGRIHLKPGGAGHAVDPRLLDCARWRVRMISDPAAYRGFFDQAVSGERVFGEITPAYSMADAGTLARRCARRRGAPPRPDL